MFQRPPLDNPPIIWPPGYVDVIRHVDQQDPCLSSVVPKQ